MLNCIIDSFSETTYIFIDLHRSLPYTIVFQGTISLDTLY